MANLVVLYKKPADKAAFDDYYFKTHVPLANKIPGLLGYQVSSGDQGNPMENVSLNYAKITVNHIGMDSKGSGSPVRAAYDLEKMAKA